MYTTTTGAIATTIEERVVIVLIAMGNVTQTNYTERCLWSLQQIGHWQGNVLVITDQANHYSHLNHHNHNHHNHKILPVVVAPAKAHHLRPTRRYTPNATTTTTMPQPQQPQQQPQQQEQEQEYVIRYKSQTMIYKRFKTLVLEYVEDYFPKNKDYLDWQYALYLDVDIVVAQPLHPFLERLLQPDQVVDSSSSRNNNSPTTTSSTTTMISTLAMFPDCPTCAKKIHNSGILWMHRQLSTYCLERWRHFFDVSPHTLRDQSLLRKLKKFVPHCHLQQLQPTSELLYPTWKDMRLLSLVPTTNTNTTTTTTTANTNANNATFIHNTNTYGSTKIPDHVQERYFAHLLKTTQFSKVEHY
jgi:hypothetical protein